jgi:hypothetical protein
MKKCPSCNSYNDELNAICEYCGIQFPDAFSENSFNENDKQSIYDNSGQYNDNAQGNYNQGNYNQGNYNQDNYNQGNFDMNNYRTTEQEKSGVWALVFGIISLFCLPIAFAPIAIYLGNESKTGLGNAGKILGIIGICLRVLSFLLNLIKIGSSF